MNERIKQLIKDAGGAGHDEDGQEPTPMLAGSDLEKFAVSLIQECADVILNNDIEQQEEYGFNHPYFGGWERGVIDSAQIVKKHFGVE